MALPANRTAIATYRQPADRRNSGAPCRLPSASALRTTRRVGFMPYGRRQAALKAGRPWPPWPIRRTSPWPSTIISTTIASARLFHGLRRHLRTLRHVRSHRVVRRHAARAVGVAKAKRRLGSNAYNGSWRYRSEAVPTPYQPGAWVPHCTLATKVIESRRDDALAFARRALAPFDVLFDAADVVAFPPVAVIQSYRLASQHSS